MTRPVVRRLRLPSFVTPETVKVLLRWAPSIRRQFSEAACRDPEAGWTVHPENARFDERLIDLLARPRGAWLFQRLMSVADPKGQRGLRQALIRAAVKALAPLRLAGGGPVEAAQQLLDADQPELAAWVAFEALAWFESQHDCDQQEPGLPTLIEENEVLREKLGNYWLDWSAGEELPDIRPSEPAERDVAVDPEQSWIRELTGLRSELAAITDPFDARVLERLRAALAVLEPLQALAAEREARGVAARAREAEERAEQLHGLLTSWPASPAWTAPFLTALSATVLFEDAYDLLVQAVAWAESLRPRIESTEAVWREAHARLEIDDGDEAEVSYHAAVEARRTLRRTAETEGKTLSARLLAIQASPAILNVVGAQPEEALDHSTHGAAATTTCEGMAEATAPLDPPDLILPEADRLVSVLELQELEPARTPNAPDDGIAPAFTLEIGISPDVENAVGNAGHPLAREAEAVMLAALRRDRHGLAAHVAAAVEALGPEAAAGVATFGGHAMLRALAVGESINAARLGAAEAQFAESDRQMLEALDSAPATSPIRLLALAAAIRPALFSSQTSASEVIRSAEPGRFGPRLRDLADFVVNSLPKRGGALELSTLVRVEGAASDETQALLREILTVAENAPRKNAVFHRATIIWRGVFERGLLADAVVALKGSHRDALSVVERAASWVDRDVDRCAYELDEEYREPRGARLESRALEWLLANLRELAVLLRRWAAATRRAQATHTSHTEETRRLACDYVRGALSDLPIPDGGPKLVAAGVARRQLDALLALLEGRATTNDPTTLEMRLFDDLLLFDPYPAGARANAWAPEEALAFLAQAADVLDRPADYKAAFRRLVEQGRFAQATQAARRLEAEGHAGAPLRQEIDDAGDIRLLGLSQRTEVLRRKVDDLMGADAEGRIDPAASVRLDDLRTRLEAAGESRGEALRWLDFPALDAELEVLDRALQDAATLLLQPLETEIDRFERDGKDVSILRNLVDRGDLTALREGVDGMREGADLDAGRAPDAPLRAFAAKFLSQAFTALPAADRSLPEVLAALEGRLDGRLFRFSIMSEADIEAAKALLIAWRRTKTPDRSAVDAVRELMTELRFGEVKITSEHPIAGGRRYSVSMRPTADRGDCPVPAFGSAAGGRVEVIVVERVSIGDGSELHKAAKDVAGPKLFVVKGVLSAQARRAFMIEARKPSAQQATALIDEATILFLASRSGRRLADLFAVALPCGGVQPYSDASGKTSPEMFFGRSRELDALWDPDGSCLVFGGRQLGKTALLEQIRLRHHQAGIRVVVYGVLQGEAEIWPLVARLLSEAGVPTKHSSRAGVKAAVDDWLAVDRTRRIVVLIDEADTYLEREMEDGYGSLIAVRDLMQSTGRRCKFVFAGLHNVQRLARTENSPLLHFGVPLRIGPLFGQDLGEAREMVTLPLAASGIVFESAGLPLRVLSAVAYYPSLVQTFGGTLLRRVNSLAHNTLNLEAPLPIVVGERQVIDALEDAHFRSSVHEKFEKTLDLDERYRLITLAMLHRSLESRGQGGAAPSLSDVAIQALARDWWPQGFEEDGSLAAFQGLLQEMVGLGVLISAGRDRYAVRSSAIAAMLGGEEQIERKLLELIQRSPPEKLDTGGLRRLDLIDKSPSPLTFRQEGVLLDARKAAGAVHLAIGSPALGQYQLATSLGDLQGDELSVQPVTYTTARQFSTGLETAAAAARAGRRNLVVLSGPWLGRMLIDEARAAAARSGARRPLKVLLAPLTIDWDAADEVDGTGRLWGADLLGLSPLGRSGLRQWLRARGATDAGSTVERLRELTGGFPLFLAGLKGSGTELLAVAEAASRRRMESPDTFVQLGLGEGRLRRAAEVIADYDTVDPCDLEGEGITSAAKALEHLERLGLLERLAEAGGTRLSLNPFLLALLARRV